MENRDACHLLGPSHHQPEKDKADSRNVQKLQIYSCQTEQASLPYNDRTIYLSLVIF